MGKCGASRYDKRQILLVDSKGYRSKGSVNVVFRVCSPLQKGKERSCHHLSQCNWIEYARPCRVQHLEGLLHHLQTGGRKSWFSAFGALCITAFPSWSIVDLDSLTLALPNTICPLCQVYVLDPSSELLLFCLRCIKAL